MISQKALLVYIFFRNFFNFLKIILTYSLLGGKKHGLPAAFLIDRTSERSKAGRIRKRFSLKMLVGKQIQHLIKYENDF